jgi:2-keto-3-deoxy-L-rhamnonate aldolase RhmA
MFLLLKLDERLFNKTKHKLKNKEKVLGAWLQLSSPISAEIFARSGFDFLIVDLEHGPGDVLTLIGELQAANAYGVEVFVRAPWNDFVAIKRILDAGAMGIHVPYVNTKEEAIAASKAAKYPPKGIRGIAGSPRASGYGINVKNYLENANDEIVVYVALETPAAVSNLDEILSVDEVDGIFIGPADLSTSMGHFFNPTHPEVAKTIRGIEEKVFKTEKFLGTVAPNFDAAHELYQRGYQLVIAMSDSAVLASSSKALVENFKKIYR